MFVLDNFMKRSNVKPLEVDLSVTSTDLGQRGSLESCPRIESMNGMPTGFLGFT